MPNIEFEERSLSEVSQKNGSAGADPYQGRRPPGLHSGLAVRRTAARPLPRVVRGLRQALTGAEREER
jgi:hypothetical protein